MFSATFPVNDPHRWTGRDEETLSVYMKGAEYAYFLNIKSLQSTSVNQLWVLGVYISNSRFGGIQTDRGTHRVAYVAFERFVKYPGRNLRMIFRMSVKIKSFWY